MRPRLSSSDARAFNKRAAALLVLLLFAAAALPATTAAIMPGRLSAFLGGQFCSSHAGQAAAATGAAASGTAPSRLSPLPTAACHHPPAWRTATLTPPALIARVRGGACAHGFGRRATQALLALPTELAALASGPVGAGVGTNTALALLGLAVKQRWLTGSGLLHAWILGVALWSTLGWRGWLVCVLYLVFGSLVTKVKQKEKEAKGIAEKRGGARGPENVWGSAAAGTMCALGALVAPALAPLMKVGYVASLATKLSDTFASEIGKAYGKRTFLITTFQPVPPGTEGAVSLEGTLAGVVGSVVMAGAGLVLGLVSAASLPLILVAAFLATNIESLLGAALQNDKYPWATNEFINFLNTLIGAAIAMGVTVAVGGK